jgi:hypothetical protein
MELENPKCRRMLESVFDKSAIAKTQQAEQVPVAGLEPGRCPI